MRVDLHVNSAILYRMEIELECEERLAVAGSNNLSRRRADRRSRRSRARGHGVTSRPSMTIFAPWATTQGGRDRRTHHFTVRLDRRTTWRRVSGDRRRRHRARELRAAWRGGRGSARAAPRRESAGSSQTPYWPAAGRPGSICWRGHRCWIRMAPAVSCCKRSSSTTRRFAQYSANLACCSEPVLRPEPSTRWTSTVAGSAIAP